MTCKLRLRLTLCFSVVLTLASSSRAATLRWAGGGADVALDPSRANQCTLVVSRDPRLASIDGFYTVWCGDGRLEFVSSVGTSSIPHVIGTRASQSIRADIASKRQTLDIGERGSSELQLVVRMLSGSKFSIRLVEIADGRALKWPLEDQPVATINGGLGAPIAPVLLSSRVEVQTDSVAFWITGLGLSGSSSVLYKGIGAAPLAFAAYGDTAIRATVPLAIAHRGRNIAVFNSSGASSFFEADVRSLIPPSTPVRLIALLKPYPAAFTPGDVEGVAASYPIDDTVDRIRRGTGAPAEEVARALVLDVAHGYDPAVVLAAIRRNSGVESADLVTRWGVEPLSEPTDPLWSEQWGLHDAVGLHCNGTIDVEPNSSINLPMAWDHPPFPPQVHVSIVDSGISGHEDVEVVENLPGLQRNKAFDNPPTDPLVDSESNPGAGLYGHGTAVASIASALTGTAGMAGASWPPLLGYDGVLPIWGGLPASLKVELEWPSITAAINWAEDEQMPIIINLSVGGEMISPTEKRALVQACRRAFMSGHLLVAGAGNTHDSILWYPACLDPFVMAVGATLWNNTYWTNANAWPASLDNVTGTKFGPWIDVTAPGGLGITAAKALPFQFEYWTLDQPGPNQCDLNYYQLGSLRTGFTGTSASAPLVSGTAVWLKRIQPTLTAEDMTQVLQRTATDLGDPGRDDYFGHGRINAGNAAAFVSRPNWIEHGGLGAGSATPLAIQSDSLSGTIAISHDDQPDPVPDGSYACVRYHLVGTKQFSSDFIATPALWVRRAESLGLPAVVSWDYDQQPPWASGVAQNAAQGQFETYVYRLTTLGNRFYPCAPEDARISYTAVAPSGTLGVPVTSLPMKLAVRTRTSPARVRVVFDIAGLGGGPTRVEVFDVSGRRLATLFEGALAGESASFEWDGQIDGAAVCRAGIYLCRVEQPGRRAACRFAYLR